MSSHYLERLFLTVTINLHIPGVVMTTLEIRTLAMAFRAAA